MKKLLLYSCIILGSNLLLSQNQISSEYFKGEVIVKIKEQYKEKCNKSAISIPSVFELVNSNKIYQTTKIFPNHIPLNLKSQKKGFVELSTIYKFKFDENIDPKKIINLLKQNEAVEYAEPNFENYLAFSPNDTANYRQWYLEAIEAYKAWDIEKGDTTVVIAITDTGADTDHADMVDDFAYNHNDPINGIDDDGDGFVDNYNGWDVANNDNDVNLSNSSHGMNCAGIASATTDNTLGVSGVGFNTKILPVRIDEESSGRLTGAYEGIVYAADHGAFIISNSWGSYNYSQFAQDIINYAAINKKALVIAAVGNDGQERRFYPAAYDNILSVGATTFGDTIKENSNFGYWIDIMAPGNHLYTTGAQNTFNYNGGTSMAGPVVAGIAALVKSKFPNYTAEQVKQKVLNSGDNVYNINNPKYLNKIGTGRVNAFKAVSETSSPGIIFENILVHDSDDSLFLEGDELSIQGDFVNYLADASNVSVSIREMNNDLELLSAKVNLGAINSSDSKSINSSPFKVKIKKGLAFNKVLEIEITIKADNYQKRQYFTLAVNPDYLTVNKNNLTLSVASNGSIGFSGENNQLGSGIRYLDGRSLLFEGGFIVGNSGNYIVNRYRGEESADRDFAVEKNISIDPPLKADFETSSIFNDKNYFNGGKLKILQKNYFYADEQNKNSAIYVYGIQNISPSNLNNLYAGLILDWDINDFSKNKIKYDQAQKMGISYSTDSNLFCGVKILSDGIQTNHYAIDNLQGSGNGSIEVFGGFSDQEKYEVISLNRETSGDSSPEGNDIIDVNSVGPFSLKSGEIKTIAFAVIVSDSESDLKLKAEESQKRYNANGLSNLTFPTVTTSKNVLLFPNPTNAELNINMSLAKAEKLELQVYDAFGKLILEREPKFFGIGNHDIQLSTESLKTGVYFLEIKNEEVNFQNTFVVSPK